MVETLVLSIVVGRHESRNAQKEKALSRRGCFAPRYLLRYDKNPIDGSNFIRYNFSILYYDERL